MFLRRQRQTRRRDFLTGFFFGGAGEIEFEHKSERIDIVSHAVGGASESANANDSGYSDLVC